MRRFGAARSMSMTRVGAALGGGAVVAPTLSTTNLASSWGFARMDPRYTSGPLFQVTRAGGSGGTFDVLQLANGKPDYASISAHWTDGWVSLAITKRYQQTPGSVWGDQTSTGTCVLDIDPGATVPNQMYNGVSPGIFTGPPVRFDATGSCDRQNITVLQVVRPRSTFTGNLGMWNLANSGGSLVAALYYGSTLMTPQYYNGAALDIASSNRAGLALPASPSVLGWTSSATERRLYCQGNSIATTADTTGAATTFSEPYMNFSGGWYGRVASFGTAIYTALSDAAAQVEITTLRSIYSIPTATSRIVIQGDSIADGLWAPLGKNLSYWLGVVKPNAEIFNLGVSGSQLLAHYTGRVSQIHPLFTSKYGAGKCVLILQGGTNDLAGAGGAAVNDASLYTTLTNFVAAEQAVGFKVVVSNLLPRADAAWTGTMEGYRYSNTPSYRSRVIANTAGADGVVDVADPATVMGALTAPASTSPKYYAEAALGLHPTDLGYSQYYAEYVAAAPIAALP